MAIYNYIGSGDLTATVSLDFNISGYIDRANNHIESLAYSIGVSPSGIATPVNFLLKEYGVAWCYRSIYQDKIGANNIGMGDADKYIVLYNIQNDEVERLRKYITSSVLEDDSTTPNSSASTVFLFRG
jgi:hypothetical protein